MGIGRALILQLARRAKWIKTHQTKFDQYDEIDQREEIMANSQGAYQLARKVKRLLNRNFGFGDVGQKPKVSKREKVSSVTRVVSGPGHAIQLTLSAPIEADVGLQPNDVVRFLSGQLAGKYLLVTSVPSSTTVLLQDYATYTGTETNVQVRFQLSDVVGSYY